MPVPQQHKPAQIVASDMARSRSQERASLTPEPPYNERTTPMNKKIARIIAVLTTAMFIVVFRGASSGWNGEDRLYVHGFAARVSASIAAVFGGFLVILGTVFSLSNDDKRRLEANSARAVRDTAYAIRESPSRCLNKRSCAGNEDGGFRTDDRKVETAITIREPCLSGRTVDAHWL